MPVRKGRTIEKIVEKVLRRLSYTIMFRKYYIIFILLSLFACSSPRNSAKSELSLEVSKIQDNGSLKFEDILKLDSEFIEQKDGIVIADYLPESLWMKIIIRNPGESVNAYIMPDRESVLRADYYLKNKDGIWEMHSGGYAVPENDIIPRNPIYFPVHLDQDSTNTVYLHYNGFFYKGISLSIVPEKIYGTVRFVRIAFQVFFLFLGFFLTLWALYTFISFRNYAYLWYIIYISLFIFNFMMSRGITLQVLNLENPEMLLNFNQVMVHIIFFTANMFIISMLQVNRVSLLLHRIMLGTNFLHFINFIVDITIIPGFDHEFFALQIINLALLVMFVSFNLYATWKGSKLSRLLIVPTLVIFICAGILNLHLLHVFSINKFAGMIIFLLIPSDFIFFIIGYHIYIRRLIRFRKTQTAISNDENVFQKYDYSSDHIFVTENPENYGLNAADEAERKNKEGSKKSYIKEEDIPDLTEKLNRLLQDEKLYLTEDLKAEHLAAEMDIKPYQLQELLNGHLGVSFSDLINRYRINEVIRLLEKYPEKKIIDLALETGFQSKSSFNRIFKEFTGTTPREYRSGLKNYAK